MELFQEYDINTRERKAKKIVCRVRNYAYMCIRAPRSSLILIVSLETLIVLSDLVDGRTIK